MKESLDTNDPVQPSFLKVPPREADQEVPWAQP